MSSENIAELIESLTPQEQAAVYEFIRFLKNSATPHQSDFLAAVNEFVEQHPELLRRLAE